MQLHNMTILQLILLAALDRACRLLDRCLRTVRGVVSLKRSWRCAWILAERK